MALHVIKSLSKSENYRLRKSLSLFFEGLTAPEGFIIPNLASAFKFKGRNVIIFSTLKHKDCHEHHR